MLKTLTSFLALQTKMNRTPSTGDTEEVSESTPDGKPVVEQPEGMCPPDQKLHWGSTSNAPLFFLFSSCPPSFIPLWYFCIVTVSFVSWLCLSTEVWVISRRDMIVLHWSRCVRMWAILYVHSCTVTLEHWPLTPYLQVRIVLASWEAQAVLLKSLNISIYSFEEYILKSLYKV